MNKILSVIIVGLFAANANALVLSKAADAAKPAAKVEAVKHTAAPAKKVSELKKSLVKAQDAKAVEAKPATAK